MRFIEPLSQESPLHRSFQRGGSRFFQGVDQLMSLRAGRLAFEEGLLTEAFLGKRGGKSGIRIFRGSAHTQAQAASGPPWAFRHRGERWFLFVRAKGGEW